MLQHKVKRQVTAHLKKYVVHYFSAAQCNVSPLSTLEHCCFDVVSLGSVSFFLIFSKGFQIMHTQHWVVNNPVLCMHNSTNLVISSGC